MKVGRPEDPGGVKKVHITVSGGKTSDGRRKIFCDECKNTWHTDKLGENNREAEAHHGKVESA